MVIPPIQDSSNRDLQLARDFVQHTGHHIFLTGKAGTGKTTFLHHLRESCPKRMIVTAPTGVAAINAGGVTLHSFFQLPFGPYVPGSDLQQRRFSKEKINIIKSLDLLVIDEISMVRADLLDGVDTVLRRFRKRQQPFGGVQLLMIGDLHQLSPVIKDQEWSLLAPYYDSCYFFSSNALKQTDMVSIELKRIYRQSDADFIRLLNRVRDNQVDDATLQTLNSRYLAGFQPREDEDYITLTTHNRNADDINDRQLEALKSGTFTFQASIEGDYPAHAYPTAERLVLKEGAQVMFVRNDSSEEKRYFNGKIGKITRIDDEQIAVQCPGDAPRDDKEILVEPVSWENIKYTLDTRTREISEEVIGRFTQFPLRLAWAITIHKSQGLTFERAIIDAGAAFSHGQVYVALSRCKTFDGMVLSSPISPSAVKTDSTVSQFVNQAGQHPPDEDQLNRARALYQQQLLLDCFDYQPLAYSLKNFTRKLRDHTKLIQCTGMDDLDALEKQTIDNIIVVADKFKRQLQTLFAPGKIPEEDAHIQERIQKAAVYFTDKLQAGPLSWLAAFSFDTDNNDIRQQINKTLDPLNQQLVIKIAGLTSCREGFATSDYLNAVARAHIDLQSRPAVKKQTMEYTASDVQHPQLLQALKDWRAQQAGEEQVEHYRILHQRVLIQIAILLPDTREALLAIKGVGKQTVEKYGEAIINLVRDYCRVQDIEPQQLPEQSDKQKEPKKDTKRASYELFLQGMSIQEIAGERGLAVTTIEGHLAHYVGTGELDVHELVNQDKIAVIQQAANNLGKDSLKVIKDHLGDAFSYGEIRLVVESLR